MVDRRNSPFGAGWWPAGVERLYATTAGALLVYGDGSAVWFKKVGSAYVAPPGEYSELTSITGGFQRQLPGNRVKVFYNSSGVTTSIREENPTPNIATYTWVGERISEIEDATGHEIRFLVNGSSRVHRIVIPGVDSIRLTQTVPSGSSHADLTTIDDPDRRLTQFTYSGATHRMATSQARATGSVSYWYHPKMGTLDSVSAPAGVTAPKKHLRTWQNAGAPTTAKPGSSSQPAITSQPWLALVRLAVKRQDVYVNDSVIVKMAMHPAGVPAWVEQPNSYRTYLHRDSVGNAIVIEDSAGVHVKQVFDSRGRMTHSIQKHRNSWHSANTIRHDTTVYGYDQTWETLTRIVPPIKKDSARFTYDAYGRRLTAWQAGLTTRLTYTARGQVDSIIAPHRTSVGVEEPNPTVYTYDGTTRNLTKIKQGTRETTYGYDPQIPTQLLSTTDPVGTEVTYELDLMKRVTEVHTLGFDNKEADVTYSYNDALRTKTMTDPEGRSTTWTYDAAGRVIKECRPTGCEETQYGDGINPTWTKRRDNSVIVRSFTKLGALQTAYFNEDTITYSYTASGQPALIKNRYAIIHRMYDPYGRLTCEQQRVRVWYDSSHFSDEDRFPQGVTAWHDYDANGRRKTTFLEEKACDPMGPYEPEEPGAPFDPFAPLPSWYSTWVPSADSIVNGFDASGNLTTIKNTYFDAGIETWTYGYDYQHSVKSLTSPHTSGTASTTWTRDNYGDLTAYSSPNAFLSNAQYDGIGRLLSATNNFGGVTNHYDGLGRLDTAYRAANGITERYAYNDAGDRVEDLWNTYNFKTNGLLESKAPKADPSCLENFTYDLRGNLREQESILDCAYFRREMWYDDRDKMYESDTRTSANTIYCSSTPRVETRQFWYDGLGRRVLMWSSNGCADDWGYWRYFWIDDHVAARTWTTVDPDDYWPTIRTVGQWFFYGPGMDNILATRTYLLGPPGFSSWMGYNFFADERGSITHVRTHTNSVVSGTAPSYFTPFGSAGGGRETTPGFNGQDAAGGLVYMRNRWYDPNTGRFTQQDPIGFAGGINLYGYAGGDPVNFSDPFGLNPDSTETQSGSTRENCGPLTHCGQQEFVRQMDENVELVNGAVAEFAVGSLVGGTARVASGAVAAAEASSVRVLMSPVGQFSIGYSQGLASSLAPTGQTGMDALKTVPSAEVAGTKLMNWGLKAGKATGFVIRNADTAVAFLKSMF